jgi:AcrR family transcriptional regulator
MTVSRTYSSPLREQQMAQTRELILEAAARLLGEAEAGELTVAAAAERAGVSVRTAYRYFATKEALFDGINEWFVRRWGIPPLYPDRLDELKAVVTRLYVSFGENEAMIRAALRTPQGVEARARRKQHQVRAITKMLEAEKLGLETAELRRIASSFQILMSSDQFTNLRDVWGFTIEEAIASTCWALDALIARVRKGKR